jgi:hypothetical protein
VKIAEAGGFVRRGAEARRLTQHGHHANSGS